VKIHHDEYILWRDLIQQRIGLFIKENQITFLSRRLQARMRTLNIHSFREYYEHITERDKNMNEWRELIELLINWESDFLRHTPSYHALMENVLPEFVKKQQNGHHLCKIWSAGCSRGQEAYSISMCFDHVFGQKENLKACITGTDISRGALARAERGEYSSFEIRNMPTSFKDKYMMPIEMNNNAEPNASKENKSLAKHRRFYRVNESIRKNVRYGYLNLNNPLDYWLSKQDVIFCQNVLIYFSLKNRAKVLSMLLKALNPEGYLFLAPGESVGIKVSGASIKSFKDNLVYQRDNREAIHVRVIK
jgi:chemotaxis protein methyltransferase CheR